MKIVDFKTFKALKATKQKELIYRLSLHKMSKPELLQELLNYHEQYKLNPNDIGATLRGQHLVEVLEERAELKELRELSQEFQRKLKARLYAQIQNLSTK